MGIFTRFAIRSLARNRTRTAVSIAGVALSVALITAVLTSAASLTEMLVDRTAADEGWWYAEAAGIDGTGLERLEDDPDVTDLVAIADMGTVALGEENSDVFGKYLYAKTWPDERGKSEPLVPEPEIVEGRAPRAPGEIILPHFLMNAELAPCGLATADGGAIGVGSAVSLDLGTRTVTNLEDGSSATATSIRGDLSDGSADSEAYAADLGRVEGTVVGFYRAYGYSSSHTLRGSTAFIYDDGGAVESALADGSDATWVGALFRTADPADAERLADSVIDVRHRSSDGVSAAHSSLIRWMGVTPATAVWNTLYQIAGILAAVIIVAGVSLVYNSFAISVVERTRQFGLLSSLGASRRQLRRTVLAEALSIGAVGIPAGLVLGLVGCHVVFGLTGEGMAVLSRGAEVRVVASPVAIAASAALGLVTLLVSAWLPAVRASRVPAVDALRQVRDVRLDRRTRRRMARGAGIRGRRPPEAGVFGVPGLIARRNLSRASSKGRVTVAALAVSVALLITSGSIAGVMGYASGTAMDAMEGQDLLLYIDATGAGSDRPLALEGGGVDGPGMQDALGAFYAEARDVSGIRANGYVTSYAADILAPPGMLDDEAAMLESGTPLLDDGSWYGSAHVEFVDDATWEGYIDGLGLPRDEFCDPSRPRAVAVDSYNVYDGSSYASYRPFAGTGTVRSLGFDDLEGLFVSGIEDDPAGGLRALYYDDEGSARYLSYDEAVASSRDIEIGALADTAPDCVASSGTLQLILPASAIDLAGNMGYARASMSFDAGGDAKAASEAQGALEQLAADHPELDVTYTNVAESRMQTRLMAAAVNTFIYCFAAITGLIAVANVFNTLASALMLRRREFAMLRSVGMGPRAFRRMIALECASYALRGFAAGFALALAVSLGLYRSMSASYPTYEFQLPWVQIGVSVAVVAAVIVASVVFALRRSGASSVAGALRGDGA